MTEEQPRVIPNLLITLKRIGREFEQAGPAVLHRQSSEDFSMLGGIIYNDKT